MIGTIQDATGTGKQAFTLADVEAERRKLGEIAGGPSGLDAVAAAIAHGKLGDFMTSLTKDLPASDPVVAQTIPWEDRAPAQWWRPERSESQSRDALTNAQPTSWPQLPEQGNLRSWLPNQQPITEGRETGPSDFWRARDPDEQPLILAGPKLPRPPTFPELFEAFRRRFFPEQQPPLQQPGPESQQPPTQQPTQPLQPQPQSLRPPQPQLQPPLPQPSQPQPQQQLPRPPSEQEQGQPGVGVGASEEPSAEPRAGTQTPSGYPNIADILAPGGKRIGEPHRRNTRVRQLPGGSAAAEELFEKLIQGATPTTSGTYKGKLFNVPGGGTVGYRPLSRSGPPTIEVEIPGLKIKLKFR